ncbi:MAG TPA: hydantoinase/oxoprolinase family protein [Candidatus Eisenbacteria bacterium]|jgi:N-methylhydantoinase A|nr:hydantoinase/oxoprolinase family protein [Candidatus Eisenbacteria bacterium]
MRIAIDTGGTFTDCVFLRDGQLQMVKVASRRDKPEEAIAEAVRQALRELGSGIKKKERGGRRADRADRELDLVCGTTVGTNALLERSGGHVALVTTAGFEDVLEIGRQARPKLYDFFVQKPEVLVASRARIGARERLAWDGAIVQPLTDGEVRRVLAAVRRERPEAVAVCLLFCFRNAKHEKKIAAALRRAGCLVSVSHEILPEYREYERTSTTVINAYLAPVMSRYLGGTRLRVGEVWDRRGIRASSVQVRVMQSNGGIISAESAALQPVTTILSGPAGGVNGALYAAQLAGIDKGITFDMGGTSTDVALLSGEPRTTSESMVAGMPVAVPMLEIHTVGAGGGSMARFDRGGALRVGPESAGAEPGPICYGRGDAPTVTDAHVVLGHFGGRGLLRGKFALDEERARLRMDQLRGAFRSVEEYAEGILAVADAVMEKAIRVISVERGHDPRDYTLIAFGGAGGLHACSLATALEMRGVLLPVFPGGLSALGILRADVVREFSRTVLLATSDARTSARLLPGFFRPLELEAGRALGDEGFASARIQIERRLDMRYSGQAYELTVPSAGDFVAAFHRAHEQRYGYHDVKRAVEIVNVRCRATGITEKPGLARMPRRGGGGVAASETLRCIFHGKPETTRLFAREDLRAGDSFIGPAVISEYSATSLIPRGWSASVDSYGQILLRRTGRARHAAK